MRRLTTPDIFNALRLIKASGTKSEFAKVALIVRENPTMSLEKIGAELILGIIEGLANNGVEDMFYHMIAAPLEIDEKELYKMPHLEVLKLLKEYVSVEPKEEWKAFFDSVAAMTKKF